MRTPGPHNDLMDQHEKLVKELSEYTKVTVTPRKNAEGFNVHIGNGHTLVSGTEASQLKMIDGYPDVKQHRLAMVEGDGIKPITARDIGGKIGALIDMRDEHIPALLDELGRMASSFSFEVNKLQHQGLDLNGDVGQNLFTDVNSPETMRSRVVSSTDSLADLEVSIEDISQLKGGEYSLSYDGDDYFVTKTDGSQVRMRQVDDFLYEEYQDPKTQEVMLKPLDGLNIKINHDLQSGERVLIRPTRNGAANMRLATEDASKITAQSYEASTAFALGEAKFNIEQAGDVREFEAYVIQPKDENGHPVGGLQVQVKDKNGELLISKPYEFEDDQHILSISIPGKDKNNSERETIFNLTEGALPDDKFTANLAVAKGENGNLRKMINIQSDKTVDDNNATIIDVYHNLNTEFGLKMSSASSLTDVARLEKESAESRVASVSGVNLDEEAANMMKFQQAYMASSRIMQAANDTFNTILALR